MPLLYAGNALYKAVSETVGDMGIEADVKKVEKMNDIVEAGVLLTPSLVVRVLTLATWREAGRPLSKLPKF